MSVEDYSGMGGLEEDGIGWEGWMAPREQAFVSKARGATQGLMRRGHRLRLEKGLSPG